MNTIDGELLQRYAKDGSEPAFEELVRRHVDLVYAAALRQVDGDAHQAEDVTQSVFADLARKAAKLAGHPSLAGWLYTSTRFLAANSRRSEFRRRVREQEAHAMNAILQSPDPEPDWARVRPLLDEAMHTLDEPDREAVLLRHFERCTYADIGAHLGLTENAARMRVERALEKLQAALARHGVTSTVAALAGLLAVNAAGAAPVALAANVMRAALAGAAAGSGLSMALMQFVTAWKFKLVASAVIAAAVLTSIIASRHRANNDFQEVGVVPLVAVADVTDGAAADTVALPEPAAAVIPAPTNGPGLHLQIIAADSGKPVPNVPIDYRSWVDGKFQGRKLTANRFGICDVDYPGNITELELTTRIDGFADTQLLWRPQTSDPIPTNYVLRLDRGVPIGGRVVDAEGKPVAGARVGWNHEEDASALSLPQNHEFGWIEVKTDEEGRWRIDRIAEDMIRRIYGSARDSNRVDAPMQWPGRDAAVVKQLRDETHLFQLGRGVTVQGIVVDADGQPVPDAKVFAGHVGESSRRETKSRSDGTFTLAGCRPGPQTVSADAEGHAVTSVMAELSEDGGPIRLTVRRGKVLRLRIADDLGNAIPRAQVWFDTFERGPIREDRPAIAQVDFSPKSDAEGRVVWSNAPDAELSMDIYVKGHTRVNEVKVRPDGEEHTIVMPKAVVVRGRVRDAGSGQLIPRFHIVMGWPRWNPVDNSTNAQWSNYSRDWHEFANGTYHHAFEDALIRGMPNPGYVMKFEADGYAPFISRVIGPREGEVEIDAALRRAAALSIVVSRPDGQRARQADVGLIFPGAQLRLIPGGFARDLVQTSGSLLHANADGVFEYRPDDAVTRIVVASPDGFADLTPERLAREQSVTLQEWGRLEVTCLSAGKPVAGRQYLLRFGGGSDQTIEFDFNSCRFTADAQGRFVAEQMPPGRHELMRLHPMGNSRRHGARTPFEIQPGETTPLSLGASNYTVTARFRFPAGTPRRPGWQIGAGLSTPLPGWNASLMTNDALRQAFLQSPAIQAALKSMRNYPGEVREDGTLTVDDVQPGSYKLGASVVDNSLKEASLPPGVQRMRVPSLFTATLDVSVPADPPSGTLDLGEIEFQTAEPR